MRGDLPQVRQECQEALEGRVEALDPLNRTTILIAGGTGFAGTWIAEMVACLNDDFGFKIRLILMARGIEGFETSRPHLAERKDIRLLRADVVFLREVPRETTWLIHAAGNPDNRFHSSSPVETMSTIVEGTANLIRALDPLSDFRRVLFLSSGYVYGTQPLTIPALQESYHGAPPLFSAASAYGEAKRCAETQLAAARTQKRLPVTVARPFAFLGPYQSIEKPWAANNFLNDALSGRPIRIFGDGESVRSYLYASDMAYWYLRLLTADDSTGPWNVGSPEHSTLRALAELIGNEFSPRPEVVLHPMTRHMPARTRFVPDVSAIRDSHGLEPRVSLAEAVARTVRWNRVHAAASRD